MLLCPLSRAPLVATKGNGLLLHFYKKQRLGNWDAEHSEEWKDLQIPSGRCEMHLHANLEAGLFFALTAEKLRYAHIRSHP